MQFAAPLLLIVPAGHIKQFGYFVPAHVPQPPIGPESVCAGQYVPASQNVQRSPEQVLAQFKPPLNSHPVAISIENMLI